MWWFHYFRIFSLVAYTQGGMSGFIVGGNYADIRNYPHSTFISIKCMKKNESLKFRCGSSIINQEILLTAAHCLHNKGYDTNVIATVGHANKSKGISRSVRKFVIHREYNTFIAFADIALIHLKVPIVLSLKTSRVALMRSPPYNEPAAVAGWGNIEENPPKTTAHLKSVNQTVIDFSKCSRIIGLLPTGTICAKNLYNEGYAAKGDSGSALVVRGFIQIGLVSFKVSKIATDLVVYTDVGYHYGWIKQNAKRLVCGRR